MERGEWANESIDSEASSSVPMVPQVTGKSLEDRMLLLGRMISEDVNEMKDEVLESFKKKFDDIKDKYVTDNEKILEELDATMMQA